MDPTPRHRRAEDDFRRMLEMGGIAPPDAVEYDEREILFRWSEQKLVVVMDLDG
jgi:hypothetical protein